MDRNGSTDVAAGGDTTGEALARVRVLEQKVDDLTSAIFTQRMIGTALGMIMQRRGCSSAEAWRALARSSQDLNVKVREIARVIVDAADGRARAEDAELLTSAIIGLFGQLNPEEARRTR